MPYKYTFITTYKCNSRCNICGIWRIYQNNPGMLENEIDKEEMKKIIKSIKDDVLWLNFTGGEPILKEGLAEVIKYAYDNCPNLAMINIPCNGLMPELTFEFFKKFVPYCKNIDIFVTVSLDAIGKDYVKTRGLDGYDKVVKSFNLLNEFSKKYTNLNVSYQMTISKLNEDSAKKTFDFIKDKGKPIVTFAHNASMFHNKGVNIDVRTEKESISKIIDKVEKEYPVNSLISFTPKIYLKLAKTFLKTGQAPITCSAGYSTTTINPYGEVFPCAYIEKSAGNVKEMEYDLKKMLTTEEAEEARKTVKKCKECWQNCEAIPSIFSHPVSVAIKYVKASKW